jgi:formylglycine-generating enzyme required for sulfatase activity
VFTQKLAHSREQRFKYDNHPAENVSWYDSLAFTRWLNARLRRIEGATWPDIPFDLTPDTLHTYNGLRLPTEWEWQYAAQNGDKANTYPWGPEWDGRKANTYESGLSRTTAVGMYPPAPCGAFDLSGNVYDWCLNTNDDLSMSLTGSASRVLRGGAFHLNSRLARASSRYGDFPSLRSSNFGFRVVVGGVVPHLSR